VAFGWGKALKSWPLLPSLLRGGASPPKNIDKRFSPSPKSMKKPSYYQRQVALIKLMLRPPVHSAL